MKDPEIKEWEIGEDGRRFRRIGSCIEHEPEISINGVMIPVSEADAYRERVRDIEKRAQTERARAQEKQKRLGVCPFSSNHNCRENCAFYSEEGCMKSPETLGRHCPISNYNCRENCMLYDNGCQLIKRIGVIK
jgi:hypothetical protein